jgi:hypothetical protein
LLICYPLFVVIHNVLKRHVQIRKLSMRLF